MGFKLEFDTDNASFAQPYFEYEVGRILEEVAHAVAHDNRPEGNIRDRNGNKIGRWEAFRTAVAAANEEVRPV